MYFKTLEKKECYGCTACVEACPKHCITMKADEEGFFYPAIDKDVCIKCGLCEKVCPFEHPKYNNADTPKVYATYLKDEKQRSQSTSGGLFYAIASWIIAQQGIVYGAAFNDNFKLRHIGIDTLEGLTRLRGSKYLQSYLGDVFAEIKRFLQAGRWVYFVGTGCQVAGLKSFLHKSYDTLVTSDLVCHGVPSQKMFDWHLDYLRDKEQAEITSYQFRDLAGWGGCETYEYVSQTRGNRKRKLYSYELSPYLYSFMHAFNYRYSCYDCKFAKVPRQGDITLADYWGVRKFFPELDLNKGVSLILINTLKGKDIWDQIKHLLVYRQSCVENAATYNGNLVHATPMPLIRKNCYELIRLRGYKNVASKEFRAPYFELLKFKETITHTAIGRCLVKNLKKIILR